MTKAIKCFLLQYFLPLVTALGGSGIILLAFYYLQYEKGLNGTLACIAAIVSIIGYIVLSFFISAKLYRWYNTEQAIKTAQEDDITFADALMYDNLQRFSAVMAMFGGFLAITASFINLTEDESVIRKIGILYVILFVISMLTLLITAGASFCLRRRRRMHGESMIGIMYFHKIVADGTDYRLCLMLPASKAPEYYDYLLKPVITTVRPSFK